MSKKKIDFRKYLNLRNVLIALVILLVALIWSRYVTGILLVIVFAPITFITVRYAKMVPHISIESNTAMSCFIGYIFGPIVGLFYGLAVGGFSYVMNSFVSITYVSTIILAGVAGFLTGTMHSAFGMPFATAYFAAIIIRTVIAFPWFTMVGISPFESFTHQTSQMFFNLVIYLPLLSALYDLLAPVI
ncbi:TPA: hypothetical protein HA239_03215 [Candidatus Woesearchaeota archaeon]|nr:hypothetical protein QT06_C0001G0073 [archaeon GW2011_AR15]MBS3104120.1 hypothetical protein [Candidatus Woesearchaeota archaeon]HIH41400.1 hypothetical protein [Candidatus Woesearchaeota archaeon]